MARCSGKVKLTKDQSLELQRMLDEGASEFSICKRFKEMVERRNDMKQYIIQCRKASLIPIKEGIERGLEKERSERKRVLGEVLRKIGNAIEGRLDSWIVQVTLTGKEAEVFNSLNLGVEAIELK
jgi:hypothetical protein